VAWSNDSSIYLVDGDGAVSRSGDNGATWRERGHTGGPPAAFESIGEQLYVALHDGTIKRSSDGGRSWIVRSTPQ
jgi:photosystem II stability/assembly factor-like uncharacterized protein